MSDAVGELCGNSSGRSGLSRCGTELRIVPYKDKNGDPQGAVVCPRCDALNLWPKRKRK